MSPKAHAITGRGASVIVCQSSGTVCFALMRAAFGSNRAMQPRGRADSPAGSCSWMQTPHGMKPEVSDGERAVGFVTVLKCKASQLHTEEGSSLRDTCVR